MRIPAIVAAAALLAGCTDADWAHVMSYAPSGPSEQALPVTPPVQPATARAGATGASERAQQECVQWAGERATDAMNQDFDEETAQKVRDATYSDCMTWAVRLHR